MIFAFIPESFFTRPTRCSFRPRTRQSSPATDAPQPRHYRERLWVFPSAEKKSFRSTPLEVISEDPPSTSIGRNFTIC